MNGKMENDSILYAHSLASHPVGIRVSLEVVPSSILEKKKKNEKKKPPLPHI